MTYKILMGAAALTLVASSVEAEPFTHDVELRATVGTTCAIINPPEVTDGLGNLTAPTAGASVFTVPIDAATQSVSDTAGELTFRDSICNTPSNVSVVRTPFKTPLVAPDGFTNLINYGVRLTWGGGDDTLVGEIEPGSELNISKNIGARSGDIALTIEVMGDDVPLVKGIYSGTVSMVITPN